MERCIRASEVIGHVVLDLASGEQVGEVRDVVYRPAKGSVIGFTFADGGMLGRARTGFVPVERIASVGDDAVMVEVRDLDRSLESPPEIEGASERDVLDDEAYTESGTRLGAVLDVVIGVGAGVEVVGYEVELQDGERVLVPRGIQRSVSGDALILRDDWRRHVAANPLDLVAADAAAGPEGESGSRGDRSKASLYREARRLDVPGRSSMSKAELATAVERARREGPPGSET